MEASQIDVLIAYLKANPLVTVVLVILVVLALGSLIRKLVKIAFILGLVFLAGLYWTNRQASSEEWKVRLEALKRKGTQLLEQGAEKAVEKGKQAIEKGKEEVEKKLSEDK